MPQHRILCKYYLQGACLKGESCQFSHSFDDPSNNVCTYYQRGICAYGSRCRYEHVKLRPKPPNMSAPAPAPAPAEVTASFSNLSLQQHQVSPYSASSSSQTSSPPTRSRTPVPPLLNAWQERRSPPPMVITHYQPPLPALPQPEPDTRAPADRPLCSTYSTSGHCPYEACPHIHGEVCDLCNKAVLHPFRPSANEEHRAQCQRTQQRARLLLMSQNIECSICYEAVMSKPTASERKFGILSGCDHPFCISCIRSWRGGPHTGMDLNTVVRACPICRTPSHYIIPSVFWYTTSEEKEEIVSSYKAKLSAIDCRHFNFGNGTCPFGTSCFYKHAYLDGRKEEVKLRHLGSADGTVIAKQPRLSDFLVNLNI